MSTTLDDDGQLRRWAITAATIALVHGAITGLLTWPVASLSAEAKDEAQAGAVTASGIAPTGGLGNPIDTRIADPRLGARFDSRLRNPARADNRKNPFVIVRPATNSGPHQLARGLGATDSQTSSGAAAGITRNAIGLVVQYPADGKGRAVEHAAPKPETNTASLTATNAIGMTVVSHSSAASESTATYPASAGINGVVNAEQAGMSRVNAVGRGPHPGMAGLQASSGVSAPGSAGHAASIGTINGTNLTRPGTRVGVVGGPAKNVGVLNGTTVTPRHP